MLHRDLDAHAYKKRRRHTPRSTLTLASDCAFWSYSKPEGARTMCRGVLGPAEQDRQERLGMLLYLEFSTLIFILSNYRLYPNRYRATHTAEEPVGSIPRSRSRWRP